MAIPICAVRHSDRGDVGAEGGIAGAGGAGDVARGRVHDQAGRQVRGRELEGTVTAIKGIVAADRQCPDGCPFYAVLRAGVKNGDIAGRVGGPVKRIQIGVVAVAYGDCDRVGTN